MYNNVNLMYRLMIAASFVFMYVERQLIQLLYIFIHNLYFVHNTITAP